jgi:hypothetical protein
MTTNYTQVRHFFRKGEHTSTVIAQYGVFCGYLYAISSEHAAELLMDMKQSAQLRGKMIDSDA